MCDIMRIKDWVDNFDGEQFTIRDVSKHIKEPYLDTKYAFLTFWERNSHNYPHLEMKTMEVNNPNPSSHPFAQKGKTARIWVFKKKPTIRRFLERFLG